MAGGGRRLCSEAGGGIQPGGGRLGEVHTIFLRPPALCRTHLSIRLTRPLSPTMPYVPHTMPYNMPYSLRTIPTPQDVVRTASQGTLVVLDMAHINPATRAW